ncbi:hypothetical protein LPN01_10695 [Sphingomonas sp. A2-49]|uniref:hypothetical protein n=1 Tax=Sphingomonas sp. A2-49 TaxID=1391375 RepID=UPI0021D2C9EA|nr:hypothetical protein [Sphingomonas sp. A2-49]MCU6454544.1 hypothetical protein [Sphingomonas sp. A2-49]
MTAWLVVLAMLDVLLFGVCGIAASPAGWPLAGHALLTAVALAIRLRARPTPGLAVPMLGMLGPVAVLASLFPWLRQPQAARPSDDARIFGPRRVRTARAGHGVAAARLLDGRVHHAAPETLGSLVAILRHGDVAARRRALETVVRSFEPGLSPLIAQALTDRDQTIRALAAAASARVAQNLLIARSAPGDDDAAPPGTLAALLADHARADVLLSDSQRRKLRDDAVAMLPANDPARPGLVLEALWAAGDYAAIDALADTVAAAPDAAGGDAARMARWWQDASAA